jgi:transketolase
MATDPDLMRRNSEDLRQLILETHAAAGGGHLGSSLSIVELLTVLFWGHFTWTSAGADPKDGDRFVLSKGHAALGLYCALAQAGRIPRERLATFGRNGSSIEPHPCEVTEPEVHASTGSLGQGLSIGLGLALGSRLSGRADRTYVLIGDGETNEGQIWEAASCAVALGLSNLVVLLDDNELQQDGPCSEIMPARWVPACWREIGWHVVEVDGHDCAALSAALEELVTAAPPAPRLLHARTVKGKGVSFLEGCVESHYPPPLSGEDMEFARYERNWRPR